MRKIEDKNEWNTNVIKCNNYNFYQSYEWGQLKSKLGWQIDRFLCEKNGQISLCQCLKKGVLGIDVIWLPGGPLLSDNSNVTIMESLLEGITDYYRKKNKFNYIRLNCQVNSSSHLEMAFRKQGFQCPYYRIATNLTYIANKDYFENIEQRLSSNWKRNLRRSFRHNFCVSIKTNVEDIEEIYKLYEETAKLKKISKTKSLDFLKEIHQLFGSRMITFLVHEDSENFSCRIILVFGRRAYDFLAATTTKGRKNYSSYFLVHKVFQWCAENSMVSFDFSGVDPLRAKGVYNFKKGTGTELVNFIGEKDKASPALLRILCNMGFYFKGIGR